MPLLQSKRKKSGHAASSKSSPELRSLEEREPIRYAMHQFRNRMEWSQTELANKLGGRSLQSVQKYEQPVPPDALLFCIEICDKMGWNDLALMLGSNKGISESQMPTDMEMADAERYILLKRTLPPHIRKNLEADIQYYERQAKRRRV